MCMYVCAWKNKTIGNNENATTKQIHECESDDFQNERIISKRKIYFVQKMKMKMNRWFFFCIAFYNILKSFNETAMWSFDDGRIRERGIFLMIIVGIILCNVFAVSIKCHDTAIKYDCNLFWPFPFFTHFLAFMHFGMKMSSIVTEYCMINNHMRRKTRENPRNLSTKSRKWKRWYWEVWHVL